MSLISLSPTRVASEITAAHICTQSKRKITKMYVPTLLVFHHKRASFLIACLSPFNFYWASEGRWWVWFWWNGTRPSNTGKFDDQESYPLSSNFVNYLTNTWMDKVGSWLDSIIAALESATDKSAYNNSIAGIEVEGVHNITIRITSAHSTRACYFCLICLIDVGMAAVHWCWWRVLVNSECKWNGVEERENQETIIDGCSSCAKKDIWEWWTQLLKILRLLLGCKSMIIVIVCVWSWSGTYWILVLTAFSNKLYKSISSFNNGFLRMKLGLYIILYLIGRTHKFDVSKIKRATKKVFLYWLKEC